MGPKDTVELPDQEYLNDRLEYAPRTGLLLWRHSEDMPANWNARYAGTQALANSVNGYLRGKIDGKAYSAHRVIWKMVHGYDPEEIDHINGDRSDNRWANLREVSHAENCFLRKRTIVSSGIQWRKDKSCWRAAIWAGGKRFGLGHHKCWGQALKARIQAEQELASYASQRA